MVLIDLIRHLHLIILLDFIIIIIINILLIGLHIGYLGYANTWVPGYAHCDVCWKPSTYLLTHCVAERFNFYMGRPL